jgi:hypothetical protein
VERPLLVVLRSYQHLYQQLGETAPAEILSVDEKSPRPLLQPLEGRQMMAQ